MVYHIIRWWATLFLRLYFRRTWVYGKPHVPPAGPLIVASNHPSAFLEASVLATVMGRPLHFLVRGDMFHPRFRWLFDVTNQIPIFRQKDGISNLRKNASSFDLTYRKLAEGQAVLIFPEAKTLLEKKLRPVQRGTAHLAFGTLPYLAEGQVLNVLPVGVNFTEPRIPGTDVVVKFGAPFAVTSGLREDRQAIEQFTQQLESAMRPLVVQVNDQGYEHVYEALVSVYFTFLASLARPDRIPEDLDRISALVNDHDPPGPDLEAVHAWRKTLKRRGMQEAVFFPGVLTSSRAWLLLILVAKSIWWIAGGWIWRALRQLIFKKIRAATFQSPTSVGVAMVTYGVLSLVLMLVLWWTACPMWWLPVWWALMAAGSWVPAPIGIIWKSITLPPKVRQHLAREVRQMRDLLQAILLS